MNVSLPLAFKHDDRSASPTRGREGSESKSPERKKGTETVSVVPTRDPGGNVKSEDPSEAKVQGIEGENGREAVEVVKAIVTSVGKRIEGSVIGETKERRTTFEAQPSSRNIVPINTKRLLEVSLSDFNDSAFDPGHADDWGLSDSEGYEAKSFEVESESGR